MYRSIPFMLSILFFSFFCCKTKRYTPETYQKSQLVFGSGGGFTGKVQTYTLLENGQLFHHNGINNLTQQMTTLSKKQTKQLFEKANDKELNNITLNDPGNMYYFLKLKKDGKEAYSFTWGGQKKPNQKADELYKNLSAVVRVELEKENKTKQNTEKENNTNNEK